MEYPHVVIIMADQLRMDALETELTPNINQLRKESVVFERAYCASPLCVPARGSFFTGRYPNVTGSLINPWEKNESVHGNVRKGIKHLYQLMEQTWDSWHTGKQHLFTEEDFEHSQKTRTHWKTLEEEYKPFLKAHQKRAPGGDAFKATLPELVFGTTTRLKKYSIPTTGCYEEGFDYFFDGFITKQSLEAMRNRDRSKPFLLNAMYLAPHPPFEIPEPWFSMVKDIELPENIGVWGKNQSPLQLYNLTGFLGSRYTRDDWSKIWTVYMGLVALLDHCVGLLIKELKTQGIYEDTIILFTSDHGEMLGSHGLWQKMCMYEESTRIPLYLKFPSSYIPNNKSIDTLISAVDVLPTLCDFLKLEMPEGLSGQSLMPLIEGKSINRDTIFIQFDGNGARGNFQRCVVQGYDKLIVDMFKDELFIEYYQLLDDPQEMNNLAFEDENAEMINYLLETLRSHMKETGDMLTLPKDTYQQFMQQYLSFKK